MLHHRLFFRIFLVIYGSFLLVHVWKIGFTSWSLVGALLGGMALAIAAHRHHGYAPSLFLVGHMVIEWHHHAVHGYHYTLSEYTFHGIHAVLDVVFLTVEAKEHYKKYAWIFLTIVGVFILGVFTYNYTQAPPSFATSPFVTQMFEIEKNLSGHHTHGGGVWHHAVIGGMLGCVISHLLLLPRWKHIH